MPEPSLVAFTLLLQAAVGAAWALGLLGAWLGPRGQVPSGWWLVTGLALLGLVASTFHLARPVRAWRALGHLGRSWLSREVLLAGAFTLAAGAAALGAPAWPALALGPALLLAMARAYRLAAVRAWNAATTPLAFLASAVLLGTLAAGAVLAAGPALPPDLAGRAWTALALVAAAAAAGQLATAGWWLRRLPQRAPFLEAWAGLVRGRLALGGLGALAAALLAARPEPGPAHLAAAAALVLGEVLGRTLFYAGRMPDGVYRHPG